MDWSFIIGIIAITAFIQWISDDDDDDDDDEEESYLSTKELKYSIGDEVTIRAKITDIDDDEDSDLNYHVETALGNLNEWISEGDIVAEEDSDDPIVPGDFVVRMADNNARPAKVTAIKKGEAWIDFAPNDPDTVANTTAKISTLRKLTNAEMRQLVGA